MKVFVTILFLLFNCVSCKKEKKKIFVSAQEPDFSVLPTDLKNKTFDTLVNDSFSRHTSKILCAKKEIILFSGYTFSFCKDSLEKIINVWMPNKLFADNLDSVTFLCRKIPFSLIETKTKRKIAAIHYRANSIQKSLCFEQGSKRPNKCIASFLTVN